MLHQEYDVEEDGDIAKAKFDWIPCNAGPVSFQRRVDEKLHIGKDAARDVKQDRVDGPPYC